MRFIDRLHYLVRTAWQLDPAAMGSFLFASCVENSRGLIHICRRVVPSVFRLQNLLSIRFVCCILIFNFFRTVDELLDEKLRAIFGMQLHLLRLQRLLLSLQLKIMLLFSTVVF